METKELKRKRIKSRKWKKLKKNHIFIGALIGLIIVIAISSRSGGSSASEGEHKGREYLISLEQMDLAAVEAKIDEHHKKEDLNPVEDVENVENMNFNTLYEDTVFMGDSIMESLSFNEIIDENRVISYMGDTVIKALEHISTLEGIQPKNLVLLYGMNDVILFEETAEWNSIDKFKENYKVLIEDIKSRLPHTTIYIQSPLPVTDKATDTNQRLTNDNLDRFREAVKQVCAETGVSYVDISGLGKVDSGLHEADGIHFKKEFYEKWLQYLRGFMNK